VPSSNRVGNLKHDEDPVVIEFIPLVEIENDECGEEVA
jgi:hypothetical protein